MTTIEWRENDDRRTHLATPGNHRALCGADVLTAPPIPEAIRTQACRLCADFALRYGIELPPMVDGPRVRDPHTLDMEL